MRYAYACLRTSHCNALTMCESQSPTTKCSTCRGETNPSHSQRSSAARGPSLQMLRARSLEGMTAALARSNRETCQRRQPVTSPPPEAKDSRPRVMNSPQGQKRHAPRPREIAPTPRRESATTHGPRPSLSMMVVDQEHQARAQERAVTDGTPPSTRGPAAPGRR